MHWMSLDVSLMATYSLFHRLLECVKELASVQASGSCALIIKVQGWLLA